MEHLKEWLIEFSEKHPYFPFGISIVALIASIAMPLLRRFLA